MSPDEPWARALRCELARAALFDEGVEAARNACVAGASIASAAITAAAYYDNPLTGTSALLACLERLAATPLAFEPFRKAFARGPDAGEPRAGFAPGFGFAPGDRAAAVLAAGRRLYKDPAAGPLGRFFFEAYERLAPCTGPLNSAGLAALVFTDGGATPELAERWFLVWRVETAVAEAQAARRAGLNAFPFLSEHYVYDGPRPPVRGFDVAALRRRVGLD